jgi:hypothetical protein
MSNSPGYFLEWSVNEAGTDCAQQALRALIETQGS